MDHIFNFLVDEVLTLEMAYIPVFCVFSQRGVEIYILGINATEFLPS